VLRRLPASKRKAESGDGLGEDGPGGTLGSELQMQQLETDTPPRADLGELDDDVRRWRDIAAVAARKLGARVVATGTSPMPVKPQAVHDPRYERMMDRFGLTGVEHLTCGCHVHVSVSSDEEAVAVLDRVRVWLPSLLAISANSPFWQAQDTGYASFRSQAMTRWPSAGPTEVFGSVQAYHQLVSDMIASGVLLDEGMVYFDARVSAHYPTVEIRVADVCLDARDSVLLAALCRGLVDTAADDWAAGRPPPLMPVSLLRLATWQAGREGVDGDLLDPATARPRPARDVLSDLVDHVRRALQQNGDLALVEERLEQVLTRGNGARRQRGVLEKTDHLGDVVADLARVTAGQDD
jgi:carboxylate-amine ligase